MSEEKLEGNIQSLSAGEHIRMRPNMYFQKCYDEKSLDSLLSEVLCHALDEYFAGVCDEINITVRKKSFTIWYNAGISLNVRTGLELTDAEIIMTKIMACSNLKKHLEVGKEFCILGLAAINFASQTSSLATVSKNKKGNFAFVDGETTSANIETCKNEKEWTEITMEPNRTIFEGLFFSYEGVKQKIAPITERFKDLKINVIDKTSEV